MYLLLIMEKLVSYLTTCFRSIYLLAMSIALMVWQMTILEILALGLLVMHLEAPIVLLVYFGW